MKRIALILSAVLIAMCSGNGLRAPEDSIAASVPVVDTETLRALSDAAPEDLLEDILRQLPKALQPREDAPDTLTELHVLPCRDHSFLVLRTCCHGAFFEDQDAPLAFTWRDGVLASCDWPLPELAYEDFVSPLAIGREAPGLREEWGPVFHYNSETFVLTASFNEINAPQTGFETACRPVEFYWNGESFQRHDGRYALIGSESFASFCLGEKLPETVPEGYRYGKSGKYMFLQENASGRRIVRLGLAEDETLGEIVVLQPEFMDEDGILWPGRSLEEVMAVLRTTPAETPAFLNGKGEVVLVLNDCFLVLVSADDLVGTPDSEGYYLDWSFRPGTLLAGVLAEWLGE